MTCDKHWTDGGRITDYCYPCDVREEMGTRDLSVVEALKREEAADPEEVAGELLLRATKHVVGHLDGWFDVEYRDDDHGSTFVHLFRDGRLVDTYDCADNLDECLWRDRYKVASRRVSESR